MRVPLHALTWVLVVTLPLLSPIVGGAQSKFKTRDLALAHYIKSANARSLAGINATFLEPVLAFNFSGSLPVERFRVVKRIRYTEKLARDWNKKGIIPPAAVGDIELHVEEIIGGKPYMYSYNFRQTASGWKIVDFVAWDDK